MEADRAALYVLLMSVPSKVVKHLQRVAQAGYDKTRVQLEAAQGGDADAEEQEAENAEVCGERMSWPVLRSMPCKGALSLSLQLDARFSELHFLLQDAVGDIDWSAVEFASVERRPLKRHRVWGIGVCIRLSMPLLVSCLFFTLIYLRMSLSTRNIYSSSEVAHAMGDRTVRSATDFKRLYSEPGLCPKCCFSSHSISFT